MADHGEREEQQPPSEVAPTPVNVPRFEKENSFPSSCCCLPSLYINTKKGDYLVSPKGEKHALPLSPEYITPYQASGILYFFLKRFIQRSPWYALLVC